MILIYRLVTVVTLMMGMSFGPTNAANPYAGKTCTGPYESSRKIIKGAYLMEFNAAGTGGAIWGNRDAAGEYAFKLLQANPDTPREALHLDRWGTFTVQAQTGEFGSFPYSFIVQMPARGTTLYLTPLSPQGTATGKDDVSARFYGAGANDVRLTCHNTAR